MTGTIEHRLPEELEQAVAERLSRAAAEDVERRLLERDATLWGPAGSPELADRLGWVTIAERLAPEAGALRAFREELQGEGFTDCLLLGMGGSSLAPEVFRRSCADSTRPPGLRLHVLDTTEPLTVRAFAERLDPERTLVLVSTKSGGTIETLSLFKHFWARFGEHGRRFAAVTDPGSGLEQLASEHGFRRTFLNDPEIGGRYSALSYFGLVPAALAGVDVGRHLEVANDGSGLWLGCALGELALRGRDKVSFVVDPPLESFGLWVEQLIAESTGKQGKGTLPIADEPFGGPYGDDRVFVHLRSAGASTPDFGDNPVITQPFGGPHDLGRIFFVWEVATAVAGWVLGINPFDQPNVQEAKDKTARALREGVSAEPGDVGELVHDLAPPAYVAIMGYLPYDEATDAAVLRLRAALLERYGVATTFGYGPRFLHSTGQYHKGGPAQGRFLQLTHDSPEDEPVPGEAFGFRRLISAQADGDLATLRAHGRPAARVVLPAGGIAGAIEELAERV